MVAQSLLLCLLISSLGGTLMTASNAVVVHMARRRQKEKQQKGEVEEVGSGKLHTVMLTCEAIFFSALAHVCIFFAPWFGPVSIFWPTYTACKLLSNMVIIGLIMGHEKIDKNIQVATMVVVASVINITITGPATQDGQNLEELFLDNMIAMIWVGILTVVYIICILLFVLGGLKDKSPTFKEILLFMISVCSSVMATTTSKMYSLLADGPIKTFMIAMSWVILVYWAYMNLLEAKHVRSLARYLPQVQFGSIILNAITGLLIWEEYQVVRSWAGYITAICLLGMGVYLLSDLDFFKVQAEDQQNFHREIETIQDFFSSIEEDLNAARLERSLSRHQITIIKNSARQGLTRGASDPEIDSRSIRSIDSQFGVGSKKNKVDATSIFSSPSKILRTIRSINSPFKKKKVDDPAVFSSPSKKHPFLRRSSGLLALSKHNLYIDESSEDDDDDESGSSIDSFFGGNVVDDDEIIAEEEEDESESNIDSLVLPFGEDDGGNVVVDDDDLIAEEDDDESESIIDSLFVPYGDDDGDNVVDGDDDLNAEEDDDESESNINSLFVPFGDDDDDNVVVDYDDVDVDVDDDLIADVEKNGSVIDIQEDDELEIIFERSDSTLFALHKDNHDYGNNVEEDDLASA